MSADLLTKFSNREATAGAAASSSLMLITVSDFGEGSGTKRDGFVVCEGCGGESDVLGAKTDVFGQCGATGAESGVSGVRLGAEYDRGDGGQNSGGAETLGRRGGADPKLGRCGGAYPAILGGFGADKAAKIGG